MILDPTLGRILLQVVLWLPIVGAVVVAIAGGGQALRGIQTGRVQNYGLVLFGGMAVIALALMFGPLLGALVAK